MDDSIYCNYCREPQREKCLECGQMEAIGRPVCETKLGETLSALKSAIATAGKWRLYLCFGLGLAPYMGILLILPQMDPDPEQLSLSSFLVIIISFSMMFMFVLIGLKWQKNAEARIRKTFLAEHSDHAEILRLDECKG